MTNSPGFIVFICGSALHGQPDHGNLAGAEFLGEALSAAAYRIHAVKDGWHPGIYEVAQGGVAIPGELYSLSKAQYEHLVSTEPPDMYPTEIRLDDGSAATAMFYPEELIRKGGWPDISDLGGWANYKRN